ncbi:MAG: hypothetical protein ABIN83_04345 [Sphingomicrobium sp.]
MRTLLIALPLALPLALIASPAVAAPRGPAPQLPRELADPAMADKLGRIAGAMSRALLDLPVGEMQAAIEGRPVTGADRNRTVRDIAGRNDPYLEQRIQQQVAGSGAAMQAGARAMASALPSILESIDRAAHEIDRATANLPQPGYPRR